MLIQCLNQQPHTTSANGNKKLTTELFAWVKKYDKQNKSSNKNSRTSGNLCENQQRLPSQN
jgi:hypothetical protein